MYIPHNKNKELEENKNFRSPICMTPVTIERGMRIAQMVVAKYEHVQWNEVPSLDETARGAGGFGSTGTKAA